MLHIALIAWMIFSGYKTFRNTDDTGKALGTMLWCAFIVFVVDVCLMCIFILIFQNAIAPAIAEYQLEMYNQMMTQYPAV